MAKSKEKKGYQGYKLEGDSAEYRKQRARKNSQDENRQSNDLFAADNPEFQQACEKAGVKPTARQASKYRNGYGRAAYAAGKNVRKVVGINL